MVSEGHMHATHFSLTAGVAACLAKGRALIGNALRIPSRFEPKPNLAGFLPSVSGMLRMTCFP
jgi:hypothetical protein